MSTDSIVLPQIPADSRLFTQSLRDSKRDEILIRSDPAITCRRGLRRRAVRFCVRHLAQGEIFSKSLGRKIFGGTAE